MTLDDLDNTKAALSVLLMALGGCLVGASGVAAANLRYGIDDLLSNADNLIRSASYGTPLLNVFNLAVAAGGTVTNMEAVRLALVALNLSTPAATALVNVGVQMVLASEVQIYSATTFTSRQDVDAALSLLNDAFEAAEEYAADHQDPTSYQALIAAHAAIVRDLSTRARPLPNMITYSFGRVLTSHALAQRLYGDASRCDELVAENKFIHPAFCAPAGTALSS